ncbi:MAG: hypothetical protein A3H49_07990 [Nitrospirae bacterium RIFCSPLOWO2_02_FULL_62_14]|nr:MAG: hypothetical protein A3H49_07990 [Nitrospirae bacterium RIFCSPLOWO2_02_FULL_62_14]OGW70531.1 MAG: hypothetical protein A3A88_01680 [Nitrospirae bacterium RIFCSPLOWO2_01_FULL_62_17]OGW93550.1 MAG: hypothetical protein A3K11_04260 [Nitrospirae bacterium RIFCSPLOWO2_12_FULL_63_8]
MPALPELRQRGYPVETVGQPEPVRLGQESQAQPELRMSGALTVVLGRRKEAVPMRDRQRAWR